jgi:SAM-dependent methyltransferase
VARQPRGQAVLFRDIANGLLETRPGQEATMYGHLRDLFVHFLGYAGREVVIDTNGDAGRPDITCRAPSGLPGPSGRPHEIDWIVLEAKDEFQCFSNLTTREAIFAEKSKYITPNTAWFVMVDPTVFIARPVLSADFNPENDVSFYFAGPESEAEFRERFASLRAEVAGVPEKLRRFRAGDTSLIATERLIAPENGTARQRNRSAVARRNFFSTLRDTTAALQEATLQTLRSVVGDVDSISASIAQFEERYGPSRFDAHSLTISARPRTYEETRSYGGDVARLNRRLRRAGSIARLAITSYPQFKARVSAKSETQALEMFATETANLVLARILLIRFFEDHEFFGQHRYLCNGGVQAFQQLREIFEQGYTRLLKMAYEKAQQLYAAAFDETELDWVFDTHDPRLSVAIEWAMYQLSRYDFTTVKGDILTGVYDRFLDREQRKRFGEYYTPPSIARYIVDRLELEDADRFLDPACGSGTFLIERYQQAVGEDADRGLASFGEVVAAVERLAGNDLNTFSAVLAQIQLLWHILGFRDELLAAEDFPDIAISDKANSIVAPDTTETAYGRWAELDRLEYGGVGGNPPYVRPERAGEVSEATRLFFERPTMQPGGAEEWPGISAEANLYALFVYRALNDWCRQANRWGEGSGRLGYVLPLALCGTRENAAIRRLFAPGGRWTIKEIVDLEVIWRHVFDADVLPMILIAEARPPRLPLPQTWLDPTTPLPPQGPLRLQVRAARLQEWIDRKAAAAPPETRQRWTAIASRNRERWQPDQVTVRLADKSILDFHEGGKRPTFRIADAPTVTVDYANLFTPDGRIMTRLTRGRQAIIAKLLMNESLPQAFKTYWLKRSGENRGRASLTAPSTDLSRWQTRQMVSRGIVFSGRRAFRPRGEGHDVYKAENIIVGEIFGEPQDRNVDLAAARNRYLFDHLAILPEKMWAVARIATCLNAVPFDPSRVAFTDTATIFAPREDLASFPFDLLFVSRIYRFVWALACRMTYMNLMRGDAFPANLRLLPWNEALALTAHPLEALRIPFLEACGNAFRTEEMMFNELAGLPLLTFRETVRAVGGSVEWSESFVRASETIEVSKALYLHSSEHGWRLQVSDYLYDHIDISDEDAARGLRAALAARPGVRVDRDMLLNMLVPPNAQVRADHDALVEMYGGTDHQAAIEAEVDRIDALVGPALGLDRNDITAIREDMLTDPFLRNITPRWPGTSTRLHGYRTGLDSAERYE